MTGEMMRNATRGPGRAGFTLPELSVAVGIGAFVTVGMLVLFSDVSRWSRANGYQIQFSSMARTASQKIVRCIENGRSVGIGSNGLDIVTVNMRVAQIRFEDADGCLDTEADNRLMYDPDTSAASGERVLCTHVSSIPGVAMFEIVPSSPNSVSIRFHVGDSTNEADAAFSGTGTGYQGVEVRVSASPRNLQRWYD
jgi:prepilin-type N-terminal cleavage/methylation domain-containing protein